MRCPMGPVWCARQTLKSSPAGDDFEVAILKLPIASSTCTHIHRIRQGGDVVVEAGRSS